MKTATPQRPITFFAAEVFGHARAVIEILGYLSAHAALVQDAMGEVLADEQFGNDIQMVAEKMAGRMSRLLYFEGNHDQAYRDHLAEHAKDLPSVAALWEMLSIVGRDSERKPDGGWGVKL